MAVTREQVNAVKSALGLDHDLTHSITILPRTVHVQTVVLTEGYPTVENGETAMESVLHEIEEVSE